MHKNDLSGSYLSSSQMQADKVRNKSADSDEISLREILVKLAAWWNHLRSKWLIIFVVCAVGALIGLAYAFYKKPLYKAKLSFALEDEKAGGGLGGALGLASQFGFDLGGSGGGAFEGDNLLELMRSRSIIQKALLTDVNVDGKLKTLANFYIDFNDLRSKWDKPELKAISFSAESDPGSFTRLQDSVLREIHKKLIENNLSVLKVDKKLSIISVNVTSKNELFSKYFSEVLVKEVSDFYIDTKTKKSSQNVAILQHQVDSVKRQLHGAISGVAVSVDANPNPNPARQILRVPSQRRQVDVQANTAILTELVKNLEVSKVSLRKETPLIQIIDEPILPLEVEKVGKVKGFVMGGLIGGFLVVLLISARLFLRNLLS